MAAAKRAAVAKRATTDVAPTPRRKHDDPLTPEEEADAHQEIVNNRKFDDRGYPLDATHDAQGFPLPNKRQARTRDWKQQRPSFGE